LNGQYQAPSSRISEGIRPSGLTCHCAKNREYRAGIILIGEAENAQQHRYPPDEGAVVLASKDHRAGSYTLADALHNTSGKNRETSCAGFD
jgi:hypothetical protein